LFGCYCCGVIRYGIIALISEIGIALDKIDPLKSLLLAVGIFIFLFFVGLIHSATIKSLYKIVATRHDLS